MYIFYFLSYINIILQIILIYYDSCIYQILYTFVGIPLIEILVPFSQNFLLPRKESFINRLVLWFWYPICLLILSMHIFFKRTSIIDSISMGIIFGMGINIAHELIHKSSKIDKFFGRRLLELSFYGFWEWQHILGHHNNVGKIKDPATAPSGMSVYQFIPRSIYGTILQSFSFAPDRFFRSLINSTYILVLTSYFGVLSFYFNSCIVGILFLEIINYIEHYGVIRKDGERVGEQHSWDAPFVYSSLLLFKLPLHSDHHLNSKKAYSELIVREKSPKLPFSYPIMMEIALIPPLFFRMMKQQEKT